MLRMKFCSGITHLFLLLPYIQYGNRIVYLVKCAAVSQFHCTTKIRKNCPLVQTRIHAHYAGNSGVSSWSFLAYRRGVRGNTTPA